MKHSTTFFVFLVVIVFNSCDKKNPPSPSSSNKTNTGSGNKYSEDIFTIAGNGYGIKTGGGGFSGDGGPATAAELYSPYGVAVDASGDIYICDCQNSRIRKVTTNGVILTFAGNGKAGFFGDGGPATAAELYFPYGVAGDAAGNLYFADYNNQRIRKVNSNGIISTVAGNGNGGYSGDGEQGTAAEINNPCGITLDGIGDIYIADNGNDRIRKVNTSGIISTVAGISFSGYSGDGGPATVAEIRFPSGVGIDNLGNIYIADYGNNCIRMVNTGGIISTIAGTGFGAPFDGGYSGDGGPATAAELFNPADVKVDGSGNVYFSDADNNRIREVNTSGVISTIAGTGIYGYSGDGGLATAADIGFSQGIAIDGSGNLYIADLYFNRIRIVYK